MNLVCFSIRWPLRLRWRQAGSLKEKLEMCELTVVPERKGISCEQFPEVIKLKNKPWKLYLKKN